MASIIKAGGPIKGGPEIRTQQFNLTNIQDQADGYLGDVRQQAEQIVAAANEQARQIRDEARQQGSQAALQALEKLVEEKVARQMRSVLPALREAVNGIRHARQAWAAQWEKGAVRLASAIAERVIRRELTRTPEIPLKLIREALNLAAGSGRLRLQMNPADYKALGDNVQQLADELAELSPSDIVPNDSISPGGCRVDSEFGEIDQQFASQLKRIEEELT